MVFDHSHRKVTKTKGTMTPEKLEVSQTFSAPASGIFFMISLMTKWFIAGKASDFASGVIIQVEVLIMCLPVAYYFFMGNLHNLFLLGTMGSCG